jgi:hypothetical protein
MTAGGEAKVEALAAESGWLASTGSSSVTFH